ncbi:MAG: D-alanyl-D-alanine carboxypeptidase family protein, partial [Oscillatoriales cyanobacterium]
MKCRSEAGLDNASLSRKPPQAPYIEVKPSQSRKKGLIWKLLGLGVVAFGVSIWLHLNFKFFPDTTRVEQSQQNPVSASSPSTPSPAVNSKSSTATPDKLLGHLPYQEAPASDLVAVTGDGGIKLRKAAATKY